MRRGNSACIRRCRLRTAYKLCPQAIFVEGHRDRYIEYSAKVFEVLQKFSPRVEMASIDEAYLDLTGTERLHGPPLRRRASAARDGQGGDGFELLHRRGGVAAGGEGRVGSGQAERRFVDRAGAGGGVSRRRSMCARFPASARSRKKNLHACGIRKVGDLAALDDAVSRRAIREMGAGAGREIARAGRGRVVRRRSGGRRRSEIDQP